MIKVGIIVLNWQQPKLTLDTVDSLLAISHHTFDYQIYLVDNGSQDTSLEQFTSKYKNNSKVIILTTSKNLGYVGGNNFGIKQAQKDLCHYSLVINNDVYVKKDFLEKLVSFSETNPDIGILGPKIYFAKGHEFYPDRYSKSQLGKVIWSAGGQMDWRNILGSNIGVDEYDQGQFDHVNFDVDFISGCCILISNDVIKRIGYFDDNYFMYLEDTDFCQRAIRSGFKIVYVPGSVIWHINAGSSSSGSQLHDYYITRNRLLFAQKYATFRARFALMRESVKFIFGNHFYKKRASLDYYLQRFGKGNI